MESARLQRHPARQQPAGRIIAYGLTTTTALAEERDEPWPRRITETIEDGLSGTPVNQVLANIPTAAILGSGKTIYFRMVKTGPRYASFYSADGTTWTPIYETGAALSNVKVGVFAFNRGGTSSDLTVSADYFRVLDTAAPVVHRSRQAGGGRSTARDDRSADRGSGVASTEYQIDGGWQPYRRRSPVANGGGRVIQAARPTWPATWRRGAQLHPRRRRRRRRHGAGDAVAPLGPAASSARSRRAAGYTARRRQRDLDGG
jgi:hypothetical protein